MLNIIIFTLFFLIIVNWFQILSFSSLIIGPKIKTKIVKDKWIHDVVKKKTGLSLFNITLFEEKKMYGMMAGLTFWPKMILTRGLYKSFNKNELEWVILHEAGHCVLWHNLQVVLIEITILLCGIFLIQTFELNLVLTLALSLILSFACIQIIRWGIEYIADKYSIDRINNPKGVITAQDKFRRNYYKNPFNDKKSILRFLLYWNITQSKRVKMAKRRLL